MHDDETKLILIFFEVAVARVGPVRRRAGATGRKVFGEIKSPEKKNSAVIIKMLMLLLPTQRNVIMALSFSLQLQRLIGSSETELCYYFFYSSDNKRL